MYQGFVPPGNPIPGLETEKEPHLDKWLRTVKVNSQDVPSSRLPLFQENESVVSTETVQNNLDIYFELWYRERLLTE